MKTSTVHLSDNILSMTESLTFEETLTAIECAEKVQAHLLKSVNSGNRYHRKNLEVVKQLIAAHKEQLFNFSHLQVV